MNNTASAELTSAEKMAASMSAPNQGGTPSASSRNKAVPEACNSPKRTRAAMPSNTGMKA